MLDRIDTNTPAQIASRLTAAQARMLLAISRGTPQLVSDIALVLPDGLYTPDIANTEYAGLTAQGRAVASVLREQPDSLVEAADAEPAPAEPAAPAPDPRIAQLEAQLAAAQHENELLKTQLNETSTKVFRKGQEISTLEKEHKSVLEASALAERMRLQAVEHAESLAQTAADLKEREMASSARAASLQKQLASMEALLASAQDDIEFNVIVNTSADDLRVAELAGWTIRHMQFENGLLNVVLRRARQRPQPRDRKPRKAAAQGLPMQRWQAPATPAAPASTGALMGTVIMPGEPCHNDHKPPMPGVMDLFRDNLKRALAEAPLIEYKPLSTYARS